MVVTTTQENNQVCEMSVVSTIDTGHEDIVHDAAMDFYGTRLATCSSDHSVKIFDIKNGSHTLIADLQGHDGPVWQVAWAHPKFGNLLASCSYDRRVVIWKESGQWSKIYEYGNHDSSVNSVSWAPPEFGLILACASSDGSVTIIYNTGSGNWEVKTIPNAHTIGCNAVSWSPAVATNLEFDAANPQQQSLVKHIVTGGCDHLVKVWKEEDEQWVEAAKLEGHSDWVRDVAWAPSIGLPRSVIASCSQDRRVIIWSSDNKTTWKSVVMHTFDDVVWNVSWSLTGNILAVSGGDNKVSLWKESTDGHWSCISEVNKDEKKASGNEQ
uniref:Protein SEC13 homolog n=1 Tax=Nicoletia phytophila TaxID=1350298 RepID=A0A481SZU8_9INSE|nr:protein transport protein sec13 [Nicoletia phytophila]